MSNSVPTQAAPSIVFGALRAPVARALEAALSGAKIGTGEATALLECDPDEVPSLLAAAGWLRDRWKGRTVTYSPKVFLPVTNLCRDRCSYCTFRRDPTEPGAWTMSPSEIREAAREGREHGCAEALLCLGDRPESAFRSYRETLHAFGCASTVDYLERACLIALEEGLLPHTNAGVLRRDEMSRLKPLNASMGLMLENVSPRLRQKGQAHYRAPDKEPAVRLRMIREAGELEIPFTTGLLVGIGETPAECAASLAAIRDLHEAYGHIQEVIIQGFRAKPGTRMAGHNEPDSFAIARVVAVARLMLPRMNIQAPPNLTPYDHRLLLAAGINDWGGLSPVTRDYVNPEAPWPYVADLRERCRAEGFQLRPRLPVYPEYLDRPGFVAPAMRPAIEGALARIGAAR